MPTAPLNVLLVSADRALLRHTGRFLQKFGYEVNQCTEPARAGAVLAGDRPDFLILDGDITSPECVQLCRAAGNDRRRPYVYTFLVADDAQPRTLTEAIQAGVDDFLSRPLIYGELLARLRAGARILEYERRVREQASWDPLTGLLSRQGFIAQARTLTGGTRAYALMKVDHLDSIRQGRGEEAVGEIVEALAGWLDQADIPREYVAHCGDGEFAAVLPAADEASAVERAEEICRAVRGTEFACGKSSARITLSIGVAMQEKNQTDPDEYLKRAAAALALAQQSGHDGAAKYSQCAADEAHWNQLAQGNQFFDTTLARHIMTPCTLTVRRDEPLSRAVALFRQTGIQAIPVVGENGALQGIVPRRAIGAAAEAGLTRQTIADVITGEITRFDEQTTMDVLMEHFLGTDEPLAVVVDGEVPTGIIARRNLRTLIEPLSQETYAPRSPFVATSDYLLVPELCPSPF